jgi:transcription antitermination factor NusG
MAKEIPVECGRDAWFALRVKPRYEKTTAAALRGKGFEEFLPLHRVRRRWSDRYKELDEPFFPGYVFCRFNPDHRLPILITPGVLSVVGIGKVPIPVEDGEIAALQSVAISGCRTQAWPFLAVGQTVCIQAGPLTGLEGLLVAVKNSSRLVVSVALLQRSVAVEIDHLWAYPVSGTGSGRANSRLPQTKTA